MYTFPKMEKCVYDLKVLWYNIYQNKNIQNTLKEEINVQKMIKLSIITE